MMIPHTQDYFDKNTDPILATIFNTSPLGYSITSNTLTEFNPFRLVMQQRISHNYDDARKLKNFRKAFATGAVLGHMAVGYNIPIDVHSIVTAQDMYKRRSPLVPGYKPTFTQITNKKSSKEIDPHFAHRKVSLLEYDQSFRKLEKQLKASCATQEFAAMHQGLGSYYNAMLYYSDARSHSRTITELNLAVLDSLVLGHQLRGSDIKARKNPLYSMLSNNSNLAIGYALAANFVDKNKGLGTLYMDVPFAKACLYGVVAQSVLEVGQSIDLSGSQRRNAKTELLQRTKEEFDVNKDTAYAAISRTLLHIARSTPNADNTQRYKFVERIANQAFPKDSRIDVDQAYAMLMRREKNLGSSKKSRLMSSDDENPVLWLLDNIGSTTIRER